MSYFSFSASNLFNLDNVCCVQLNWRWDFILAKFVNILTARVWDVIVQTISKVCAYQWCSIINMLLCLFSAFGSDTKKASTATCESQNKGVQIYCFCLSTFLTNIYFVGWSCWLNYSLLFYIIFNQACFFLLNLVSTIVRYYAMQINVLPIIMKVYISKGTTCN